MRLKLIPTKSAAGPHILIRAEMLSSALCLWRSSAVYKWDREFEAPHHVLRQWLEARAERAWRRKAADSGRWSRRSAQSCRCCSRCGELVCGNAPAGRLSVPSPAQKSSEKEDASKSVERDAEDLEVVLARICEGKRLTGRRESGHSLSKTVEPTPARVWECN